MAPDDSGRSADESGPALSLCDVPAVLLGLSPADLEELASVRRALVEASADGSAHARVREQCEIAAARVDRVLDGKAEDPDAELAAAGGTVEDALRGAETAEPASGGSDPAAPASAADANDASPMLPADTDLELLSEFVAESLDHIQAAEAALLDLEANPQQSEPIHTIFRAFHTIKGSSAFLGLDWVEHLAHLAENLLSRARDGEILLTGGYADLILASCDALNIILGDLQGAECGQSLSVPPNYAELVAELTDPEGAGIGAEVADEADVVPRIGDILVAEGKVNREDVEVAAVDQGQTPIGETLLKFGMPTAEQTEETCIIVVDVGEVEMGIVVDKVSEVMDIASDEIEDAPSFGVDVNTEFILGMGKAESKVTILLNIGKVLTGAEAAALAAPGQPNE